MPLKDFVDFDVFVRSPPDIYNLSSGVYKEIQKMRNKMKGAFFNHYYIPPSVPPHVKFGFWFVIPSNIELAKEFRNQTLPRFSSIITKVTPLSPPSGGDRRMSIPVDYIKCWTNDLYFLIREQQIDIGDIPQVYYILFRLFDEGLGLNITQKSDVYKNLCGMWRVPINLKLSFLKMPPKITVKLNLNVLRQYSEVISQAIKQYAQADFNHNQLHTVYERIFHHCNNQLRLNESVIVAYLVQIWAK